jgi:hypothetical protein
MNSLTGVNGTRGRRMDRTGQDRTGQDRTGQDRTGQDRTGQGRVGKDSTKQVRLTGILSYLTCC